jgi:hypothetical protein
LQRSASCQYNYYKLKHCVAMLLAVCDLQFSSHADFTSSKLYMCLLAGAKAGGSSACSSQHPTLLQHPQGHLHWTGSWLQAGSSSSSKRCQTQQALVLQQQQQQQQVLLPGLATAAALPAGMKMQPILAGSSSSSMRRLAALQAIVTKVAAAAAAVQAGSGLQM